MQIAMADVEELLVVFMYVVAGLSVGKYDEREVSRQRAKDNVYAPQSFDGRVDPRDGAMAAWPHPPVQARRNNEGYNGGYAQGYNGVTLSRLYSLSIVDLSFVWG